MMTPALKLKRVPVGTLSMVLAVGFEPTKTTRFELARYAVLYAST